MSRRKQLNVCSALESSAELDNVVEQSDKFLAVVDVHLGWTGPCSVLEPIYRKAYIELEKADERVKFYTIDVAKLSPKQRQGLPITDGCKPLFVIYKNKVSVGKVLGANAPELEAAIFDNVFPVPELEAGA